MQELQTIAEKLKLSKEALIKAERLISVGKRAGEDMSKYELEYRNRVKRFQRWESVLQEEGYVI